MTLGAVDTAVPAVADWPLPALTAIWVAAVAAMTVITPESAVKLPSSAWIRPVPTEMAGEGRAGPAASG